MTLKVIGAGFGRTGTRSLKAALEQLGFGKCYHMEEVIKHPRHLKRWVEAAENGETDWNALFKGYQSAVDWPTSAFYPALMDAYPDAKVILTVRDPESWYESISTTLYPLGQKYSKYLRWIPPARRFIQTVNTIIWEGIFENRLEDKAFAIQVFKEHIEEVKRLVPQERLLVFEAQQGWQPLCAFLGVPVPKDRPFPHMNGRAMWVRLLDYGEFAIWGALISILVLLIWLARWASSPPEEPLNSEGKN